MDAAFMRDCDLFPVPTYKNKVRLGIIEVFPEAISHWVIFWAHITGHNSHKAFSILSIKTTAAERRVRSGWDLIPMSGV